MVFHSIVLFNIFKSNLLSIPEFKSLIDITYDEDCYNVTSQIIFKSELANQIEFETGVYFVKFKCSTNDNRDFVKNRNLFLKNK